MSKRTRALAHVRSERTLEDQLATHENRSHSVTNEGSRILPECRAAHRSYRIREVPVVPEIAEIAANLQLHVFVQYNRFQQAEIPLLELRPTERIAAEITAARHRIRENAVWPQRGGDNTCSIYRSVKGSNP